MTNKQTILHIALPSPLYHCFDYLLPSNYTSNESILGFMRIILHSSLNVLQSEKLKIEQLFLLFSLIRTSKSERNLMHLKPRTNPLEAYKPNHLKPGIRIKIPFGNQERIGILINIDNKSQLNPSQLKPIIEIIDQQPLLTTSLMKLTKWAIDYYHHPIGDVMFTALPKLLRNGKPLIDKLNHPTIPKTDTNKPPTPTTHQQQAIDTITTSSGFNIFLLDGITGSGKTEVYLRAISKVIEQKKQALILVPEIGLTPQTVNRFQQRFLTPIALMHSKLTDRKRLQAWQMAKDGIAPIIIGTRSAIFVPMKNPGIIIVDEEHDISFKQQSGFRYSARDLAIVRGKLENIPIILGSATPSLESLHNVNRKKYARLHLPERAGNAIHPEFKLIDLRNQKKHAGISELLIQQINVHLKNDGQVLLFLNRRGYAPTLICHSCGWVASCKHCDARMTLHQQPKYLHCHHCGATHPVVNKCPQCGYDKLRPLGTGTEKLEEKLTELFPNTALVRVDRDSTRKKDSMNNILNEINNNQYKILVGTQMLAKGHHFPNVTLAAILDADTGLLSSDFRAAEHIAQLIIQVAGRAGRAEKPGTVFIQTYDPAHPLLQRLMQHGYHDFAQSTLQERKLAHLPPITHFALLRAEAKTNELAMDFLKKIKDGTITENQLLGPVPAQMQRKKNLYRAQLLINSNNRAQLHKTIDKIVKQIIDLKPNRNIRWSLDIDPIETL